MAGVSLVAGLLVPLEPPPPQAARRSAAATVVPAVANPTRPSVVLIMQRVSLLVVQELACGDRARAWRCWRGT